MPLLSVLQSLTEDGRLQIEIVNSSGYDASRVANSTNWNEVNTTSRSMLYCEEEQPCSIIFAVRSSHPHLLYYQGIDDIENGHRCKPVTASANRYGRADDMNTLISAGTNTIRSGWVGEELYRSPTQTLLSNTHDSALQSISEETWEQYKCPRTCKPHLDERHTLGGANYDNNNNCNCNPVTTLSNCCTCVDNMLEDRPRLIKEELPDGILLPGERRVLVLDIDDPEYLNSLIASRLSCQRSSPSMCTNDPFSPLYGLTSEGSNNNNNNNRYTNKAYNSGTRNNAYEEHNIFESSQQSSYSQMSSSGSVSTYDMAEPNTQYLTNNLYSSPSPNSPLSNMSNNEYPISTTRENNNINNNNYYKNNGNNGVFSSYSNGMVRRTNALATYPQPRMSSIGGGNNNNSINSSNSISCSIQSNVRCVPATLNCNARPNLNGVISPTHPAIYIYYERLGDDGGCVDAARRWLRSEQASYAAWQHVYIKAIVRLEKKKEEEYSKRKTRKQTNKKSFATTTTTFNNNTTNNINNISNGIVNHDTNTRCEYQAQRVHPILPVLSKSCYRRIIPPVLGSSIRWRRDNWNGSEATKVAVVVQSIDVAALSFGYYYCGNRDHKACACFHNYNGQDSSSSSNIGNPKLQPITHHAPRGALPNAIPDTLHSNRYDDYHYNNNNCHLFVEPSPAERYSTTTTITSKNTLKKQKGKLPPSYESTHRHSLSKSAQKMFNMSRVGGGMVMLTLNFMNRATVSSSSRSPLLMNGVNNSRNISVAAHSREMSRSNANGQWAGYNNYNYNNTNNNINNNNITNNSNIPYITTSPVNDNVYDNSYDTNNPTNAAITVTYNDIDATHDSYSHKSTLINTTPTNNNTSTSNATSKLNRQSGIVIANNNTNVNSINNNNNLSSNNINSVSVSKSNRGMLSMETIEEPLTNETEDNKPNHKFSNALDSNNRMRPGKGLALLDQTSPQINRYDVFEEEQHNRELSPMSRQKQQQLHRNVNNNNNINKNKKWAKDNTTRTKSSASPTSPSEGRLIAERTYYQYNSPTLPFLPVAINNTQLPQPCTDAELLESAIRSRQECAGSAPLLNDMSGKVFSPLAWTAKRSVLRSNVCCDCPDNTVSNEYGTLPATQTTATLTSIADPYRYYNSNQINTYYNPVVNTCNISSASLTPSMSRSTTEMYNFNNNNSSNAGGGSFTPSNTSFIGGIIHFDKWEDWCHTWRNAFKESRNALQQLRDRWRSEADTQLSIKANKRAHDELCSSTSTSINEMDSSITNANFANNTRWVRRFSWLPTLQGKRSLGITSDVIRINNNPVSHPPVIVIGFVTILITLLDVIASLPEFFTEHLGFVWSALHFIMNVLISLCPTVLNTSISFIKNMILVDSNVSAMRLVFMPVCICSALGIILFVVWSLLFVENEEYAMYNSYW